MPLEYTCERLLIHRCVVVQKYECVVRTQMPASIYKSRWNFQAQTASIPFVPPSVCQDAWNSQKQVGERSFCFAFLICTVGLCKRFLSPFRRLTFSTFVLLFLHSKQRTSICALPKSYFRRKRNLRWRARKRKRSSLERLQSIFG